MKKSVLCQSSAWLCAWKSHWSHLSPASSSSIAMWMKLFYSNRKQKFPERYSRSSTLAATLLNFIVVNQVTKITAIFKHLHQPRSNWCILTFAPLFMKMAMKPHLLKVSVLFYLTLNKGENSNPKEKTQTKKPKTTAFTNPRHCMPILFFTGSSRTFTGIRN